MKVRLLILSICLFLRIWGADIKLIAAISTIGMAGIIYSMITSALGGKGRKSSWHKIGILAGAGIVGLIAVWFLMKNIWTEENFMRIAAVTAIAALIPFIIGTIISRSQGKISFFGGVLTASAVTVLVATFAMYFLTSNDVMSDIADKVLAFAK